MAKRKSKAPVQEQDASEVIEISVPAGVGDAWWVALTLDPSKRYHVRIPSAPPQRSKDFWELMPFVESVEHDDTLFYKGSQHNVSHELNSHLESGKRLETYNGRANWGLIGELQITEEHKQQFREKVEIIETGGCLKLGLYESTTTHGWRKQAWTALQWASILNQIAVNAKAKGGKLRVFIFGAEYDNMPDSIMQSCKDFEIQFTDCRGLKWGASLHGMSFMDAFIGFASGVPIMAEQLGLPTIMGFPHTLDKMQNTFCLPNSKIWKGGRFGNYLEWVRWIQQNNWPYNAINESAKP